MRIDSEQLPQHLARGIKPLYTIVGDEMLLALEAADKLRATAITQGFDERRVLIAESDFDWGELAMVGSSLSITSCGVRSPARPTRRAWPIR